MRINLSNKTPSKKKVQGKKKKEDKDKPEIVESSWIIMLADWNVERDYMALILEIKIHLNSERYVVWLSVYAKLKSTFTKINSEDLMIWKKSIISSLLRIYWWEISPNFGWWAENKYPNYLTVTDWKPRSRGSLTSQGSGGKQRLPPNAPPFKIPAKWMEAGSGPVMFRAP